MTFETYRKMRRFWEALGWVVLISFGFVVSFMTTWIDNARVDTETQIWELLTWEATSHVAIGLVVPLMLWFDSLFPLSLETWRRNLTIHAFLTVPWSIAHVLLMYWSRVGMYLATDDGVTYSWNSWWRQFGYEYLKDFRSYAMFLAVVYLYRFVLRRLQGEAGYLKEGKDDAESVEVLGLMRIKKLGREFVVSVDEIDWIESCGNYVNLNVGRHVYPLRETMNGIAERFAPLGFQRVHRSAIVNLKRVIEISAFSSGDAEARLCSGATVPVSRRFRRLLRNRLEQNKQRTALPA